MEYTFFPKGDFLSPLKLVSKEEEEYQSQIRKAMDSALEKNARFIFLAGPSCSGKTTTSLALVKGLEAMGKRVLTFSTDDFFFDQETAPKNEDGTPNYDAFEHTDFDLLIRCIAKFSQKKSANLPLFDFVSGKRRLDAVMVSGKKYDIFIVEGIHALNDRILKSLPQEIPCLCLYLDVTRGVKLEGQEEGLFPEEIRFCRRLIRDYKHRNADADRTFSLWKNVLCSEKEILHPFRKNANAVISTNFSYEIPVERAEVTELLSRVGKNSPFFRKAHLLEKKIISFPSLPEEIVPENSVLREFID